MKTYFYSLLFLALMTSNLRGDIIFANGQSNTVDSSLNDWVSVNNSGGNPTTVIFNSGAEVNGTNSNDESVAVFRRSSIRVDAGFFENDIAAYNRSTVDIYGGILDDDLKAYNRSTVNIFGGSVADDVEAVGNSLITIAGGSFGEDIEAFDGGTIIVSGGNLFQKGAIGSGFNSGNGGSILIEGKDITVNGSVVNGEIADLSGTISGILKDGTAFSASFDRNIGGSLGGISVQAVPEANAFFLLVALMLPAIFLVRYQRNLLALVR